MTKVPSLFCYWPCRKERHSIFATGTRRLIPRYMNVQWGLCFSYKLATWKLGLSFHLSLCLLIGLSVCLSIPPSVRPSICPSVCPSICPSIGPSVCPSVRPTVHPSDCPSIHPSVHPSVHPTVGPGDLSKSRSLVQIVHWSNLFMT